MKTGLTRRRLLAASAAAGVAPAAALAKSPARGGGGTLAAAPIPVVTSSSQGATQNVFFSYQIIASNSPTSYNATGLTGTGLSVNTSTGMITGTPPTVGPYTIGLSATNASGTGTGTLSLNVMAPGATLNYVSLPIANLGTFASGGYENSIGMQIQVGSTAITLTQAGRYKSNVDNTRTHTINIFPVPQQDGLTVPGGTTTFNMAGGTVGTFVYGTLQGPTVLNAGATYYILCTESPIGIPGDSFYQNSVCSVTAAATLLGGIDARPAGTTGGDPYPAIHLFSVPNQQHGPLDFKYTVGAGVPSLIVGSTYPSGASNSFQTRNLDTGPVSGPIVLQGIYVAGMSGTLTYQWMINGAPLSPVLTWTNWALPNYLDWTFDTTTKPNGTYVVYPQALDWTNGSIGTLGGWGQSIIINNAGGNASIAAGQLVPMAPFSVHGENPRPDFLTYDGVPNPTHTTYPITYTFITPGIDPTAPGVPNNPTLRDPALWYGEVQPGPRNIEYYGAPQWCTTITGGVMVQYNYPLSTLLTETTSYDHTVLTNTMDGTRMNSFVSPYANFTENLALSGEWYGAEIGGRIFKIDRFGTTTTVYGPRRNKNVLTLAYTPADIRTGPNDVEAIQEFVGAAPPADMDGANDVCFDTRNPNILYVPCQLENWIAAINLAASPVTCAIYAGTPGTAGPDSASPVAALSATFNAPTSIIMDSAGVMYVCDRNNTAIRKILPGASPGLAGNVSTLVGGVLSPTTPPPATTMVALGASYPVTSLIWNNTTHTGTLTLTSGPSIAFVLGQHLGLQGSTNSLGTPPTNNVNWGTLASGDYSHKFVVTAVASTTSYTLKWWDFDQEPAIGTLTGTMTMSAFNQDLYSPPGTVTGINNMYICHANWIDFASPGPNPGTKIVFGEAIMNSVRLLDLSTSTVRRVGFADALMDNDPDGSWFWGKCDWAGTCGPIDDVFAWKGQTNRSAAHQTWRLSLAVGSTPGQPVYQNVAFDDSNQYGMPSYAPMHALQGGEGHYPWAIGLSRVEGRMISGGVADWHCVMIRIKQTSDPTVSVGGNVNFSQSHWNAGNDINTSGTVLGFPWTSRPSFEALYGRFGGTFVGNGNVGSFGNIHTFEDMFGMTDANLAAFIQGGMGGAVPRPEITGNALRDYVYFIRRCAMQGNFGPTPVAPGADDPDRTPPVFTALSASRINATTIQITCSTGKPTLGFAGGGSTTQAITYGYYPMWSAIESSHSTSHTHTITVPSGMTPIHVTAIAKDLAGNIVHSVDTVVT